ncbi:MAG: site-2 protease family protein [Candidatus Doudnabacteria bacterium]|nr:site-2 protease family protein [Candidatus Doudnabacteria bacterium]
MDPFSVIFFIFILLFSVIFHEVAHGLVADWLGDPTARYSGRLTLNPIPHIDPFGSILLPAILYLVGSPFIFGAAKPVPVNYQNLRNFRRDMILVALAGPATNFLLAGAASLVFRFFPGISEQGQALVFQIILLNLILGIFNLIPIPPLDGSKVLASALGFVDRGLMYWILELERFGFILIFLFLFTGLFSSILLPLVSACVKFLLGTDFQL